jgi:hypothetical protein
VGGVVRVLFVVGRGCFEGCRMFLGSRLCRLGGVVVCSGYQKVGGISKCSGCQCSGVLLSNTFLSLVVLLLSIGLVSILFAFVACYWCGFFGSVIQHGVIVVEFCLGRGAIMVLVWLFVLPMVRQCQLLRG